MLEVVQVSVGKLSRSACHQQHKPSITPIVCMGRMNKSSWRDIRRDQVSKSLGGTNSGTCQANKPCPRFSRERNYGRIEFIIQTYKIPRCNLRHRVSMWKESPLDMQLSSALSIPSLSSLPLPPVPLRYLPYKSNP